MPGTPEEQLRKIAEEIAAQARGQETRLDREILDLETKLTKVLAARETARLSPERLADFTIHLGRDYQCPRCWIKGETRAALTPIPGAPNEDRFRCKTCGFECSISFGI